MTAFTGQGPSIKINGIDCIFTSLQAGDLVEFNGTNFTNSSSAGAGVDSVTNSDGTITFSPTTGNVVGSIALGHANTWTGVQTLELPVIADATDATKNIKFTLSGMTTGVTLTLVSSQSASHTLTIPNLPSNSVVATTATTNNFSGNNLFIDGATGFIINNAADTTKILAHNLTGMTTGVTLTLASAQSTSQTLNYPNITGTDTLTTLGLAQTWTAAQTFTQSDFKLLGSSTGATTLNSGLSGSGNNTLTLPTTASDTLAALGTAQTFTAVQTITNGDLALLGTSTGKTTLNSGLTSTTNNTLTLPITASDTLAALGTVQTWTAVQTLELPFIADSSDSTKKIGFTLSGATTGTTLTLVSSQTASRNLTIPVLGANDTVMTLGTAQTVTGAKTLELPFIADSTDSTKNIGFTLSGQTTAVTLTIVSAQTAAHNLTIPILAGNDTLATLGLAQTFTAQQTFSSSSGIKVGGAGAGQLTIIAANNASSFTLTAPASTDTIAGIGTAQTWSALQTFGTNISFMGEQLSGSITSGGVLYTNGTNWLCNADFLVNASGVVTKYRNISTAGNQGIPAVYGTAFTGTVTSTQSNFATYTPAASVGQYLITINISTTSSTNTGTITTTITYASTQAGAVTRTVLMQALAGTTTTAPTGASSDWSGVVCITTDSSATAINITATVAGSVSYAATADIIEVK